MADAGDKTAGQAGDGVRNAIAIAIGGVKDQTAFLIVERETDRGDRCAITGKVDRHAEGAIGGVDWSSRDAETWHGNARPLDSKGVGIFIAIIVDNRERRNT